METWATGAQEARIGARTAAALLVSGALALTLGETAAAASGTRGLLPVVVAVAAALLLLGAVLWTAHDRLPYATLVGTSLLIVLTVLATDLLTADAGGGAQVALLLPVVYAAAFLRPLAAWLTAALAILSELVLTFTLLPADAAVTDSSLVVVAIAAVTTVLAAAGRRQRALVAQLQRLASLDSVTGLATRRVFEERLEAAVSAPAPAGRRRRPTDALAHPLEQGVGVLVVDVDRFKGFNDTHGHPGGDAALVHVAQVLRVGVRGGDTVARLGGDELAVLLPGVGPRDLERRAEALRLAVRETPLRWEGSEVGLTVSVGVAHAHVGDADARRLYAAADAALYRAKREGRDRTAVAPSTSGAPSRTASGTDPTASPAPASTA